MARYDESFADSFKRDNEQQVFLDKIRISASIIQKEAQLISDYNELINKINREIYVKQDIKKYPLFWDCWQTIGQLYDFVEYSKLEDEKFKEDSDKDKINKLKGTISKYRGGDIGFEDLKRAYDLIREFISRFGYHDDSFLSGDRRSLWDEP